MSRTIQIEKLKAAIAAGTLVTVVGTGVSTLRIELVR